MTTWAKNRSEFLGLLTGVDERDAFSQRQRFPVFRPPDAGDAVELGKPPLTAQNDIQALVYEALDLLRKWLVRSSDPPPTAQGLMDHPEVHRIFSKVAQAMVDPSSAVPNEGRTGSDRKESRADRRFVVLRKAVKGLVAEAYIEQIRNEFARELARSLAAFQTRLAKDRAKDDWRDELDGGVVLYDAFRPTLWEAYQDAWDKWRADMERIHVLTTHLQRLDETLTQEEENP